MPGAASPAAPFAAVRARPFTAPFALWSKLVTAGLDQMALGWRWLETLQATGNVLAHRGDTIDRTLRSSPAGVRSAARAELARLIPEKIDAFSRSGAAAFNGTLTLHRAWLAQLERTQRLLLAGKLPTFADLADAGTAALTTSAVATRLGRDALAPVHRKVTANARRLSRKAPARRPGRA